MAGLNYQAALEGLRGFQDERRRARQAWRMLRQDRRDQDEMLRRDRFEATVAADQERRMRERLLSDEMKDSALQRLLAIQENNRAGVQLEDDILTSGVRRDVLVDENQRAGVQLEDDLKNSRLQRQAVRAEAQRGPEIDRRDLPDYTDARAYVIGIARNSGVPEEAMLTEDREGNRVMTPRMGTVIEAMNQYRGQPEYRAILRDQGPVEADEWAFNQAAKRHGLLTEEGRPAGIREDEGPGLIDRARGFMDSSAGFLVQPAARVAAGLVDARVGIRDDERAETSRDITQGLRQSREIRARNRAAARGDDGRYSVNSEKLGGRRVSPRELIQAAMRTYGLTEDEAIDELMRDGVLLPSQRR